MSFSLGQQIDEIDRELEYRTNVYARLIASGKLRKSIAEYQNDRLKAARATLCWLRDNEPLIKHRLNESATNQVRNASNG